MSHDAEDFDSRYPPGTPMHNGAHCLICGNGLLMDIEYLPYSRFVVEKAECPHCKEVRRFDRHSVQ